MILVIFDENLSWRHASALDTIDSGSLKVIGVRKLFPEVDKKDTISDLEIVQHAEKQTDNCIILTSDTDFKKRDLHPLSRESKNIGLFMIKVGGMKGFDKFKFIVKHWEEIRRISLEEKAPFVYSVNQSGINKQS